MAENMGIAPTYSSGNVMSKMMNNPIYQQKYAQLENQGMDKRAVSNINQVLGQDLAREQTRLMDMDAQSRELSRRKDKLDYAQKALEHERGQFNIRTEQQDVARSFEDTRFHTELDTIVSQNNMERDLGIKQGDLTREFRVYSQEANRRLDNTNFQNNAAIEEAKLGMEESVFGLEFGLGLLSTGTSLYSDYKQSNYDRDEKTREDALYRMRVNEYNKNAGINYNNIVTGNPEE